MAVGATPTSGYNIDDQQHEEARCADRWSTMDVAATEPDRQWDGLIGWFLVGWFLERGDADPVLLSTPYLRAWQIVAKAALTGFVERPQCCGTPGRRYQAEDWRGIQRCAKSR